MKKRSCDVGTKKTPTSFEVGFWDKALAMTCCSPPLRGARNGFGRCVRFHAVQAGSLPDALKDNTPDHSVRGIAWDKALAMTYSCMA